MGGLSSRHPVSWFLCVAVLLGLLVQVSHCYDQKLEVKNDVREQFFIENFGFKKGGIFHMRVDKFEVINKSNKEPVDYETYKNQVLFLQRVTQTDSSEFLEGVTCPRNGEGIVKGAIDDTLFTQKWTESGKHDLEMVIDAPGLFNLYFVNCLHKEAYVNFEIHLVEYNVENGVKDYLPIGLSPIPTIYGVFSMCYIVIGVIWIFHYMRGKGNVLNKVHYLMTVLVVLKFVSMLLYAIEQHYVKRNGSYRAWEIAYYVFAILKTGFFFVIVTLIGTGWSFFKPFLSDKDKKVIMVVIPLQVLDNIALVIIGVDDPGSQGLFTWKDIFRLVDIICCGAVLIPIIWSIKHLREASQSDGKAARNLQKLRLFRQFYLIVVSYIYFTRIIVYLLDATLQYYLLWLGDVFTELATLIFFSVVGYKFRPVPNNPYFHLEEEDAVRMEELRSGELDL